MLGVLLVELNTSVSMDRLVDLLWGEQPPRTARSIIQVQVSHLRKTFPGLIETTPGGYRAHAEPERVDLHRFRRLVQMARTVAPEESLRRWEEALDCWTGIPFHELGSEQLWYTVGAPLVEECWTARAQWAEAGLTQHRYPELITGLTPLVRKDPLRERLSYLLIRALYYGGHRARALAVYHELRQQLVDEYGIDPSSEIIELYEHILTEPDQTGPQVSAAGPGDTARRTPPAQSVAEVASPLRNDLPREVPDFTGRESDAVRVLAAVASDDVGLCALTGPGGVGKTSLVTHVAHRVATSYPDGQLFLDLHGHSSHRSPLSPRAALGTLLRAAGTLAADVPERTEERAAMWRAVITNRRFLLVLDNAANTGQINPLLPATPGSLTLATSRQDLSFLTGSRTVSLAAFDPDESVELLRTIVGPERIHAEPQEVRRVAELCGGLPLALRIIGARMVGRPQWTFAGLERRLHTEERRLQELRTQGQSVSGVFEVSFRQLRPEQRNAFLLLGRMLGDSIDSFGAAALLDCVLQDAEEMLEELVQACLLQERRPGMFRFHDLLAVFARRQGASELAPTVVADARHRLAQHYRRTAQLAAHWLGPRAHELSTDEADQDRWSSRNAALTWFDAHATNLVAAVDHFAECGSGGTAAWQLTDALGRHYAAQGNLDPWLATHEKVLSVTRSEGDSTGIAVTMVGLGTAHCLSGRFALARRMLVEARSRFVRLGDRVGEMRATANLAMVDERMGRFSEALGSFTRVLDYAVERSDVELEALQRTNIALVRTILGEVDEASAQCTIVLNLCKDGQLAHRRASALRILALVYCRQGELSSALAHVDQALSLFEELGDTTGIVYTRNKAAVVRREAGQLDAALTGHQSALDLGQKHGNRDAEAGIQVDLGDTLLLVQAHRDAHLAYTRALSLARNRVERYIEGRANLGLAELAETVLSRAEAKQALEQAVEILTELGVPEANRAWELRAVWA